jgi:hypothetical protein
MADKNTENKNGDDLGYGSQGNNMLNEGLTLMQTNRKRADKNTNQMIEHENWTRNGKPNRNDHMDVTEIIILNKIRSNTGKAMTPGGETDFLTQVPTGSACENREGGDRWTGTVEMRCSLVESLD